MWHEDTDRIRKAIKSVRPKRPPILNKSKHFRGSSMDPTATQWFFEIKKETINTKILSVFDENDCS